MKSLFFLLTLFSVVFLKAQTAELDHIRETNKQIACIVYKYPDSALQCSIRLLQFERKLMDEDLVGSEFWLEVSTTINQIGVIQLHKGNVHKANQYYFKSLQIAEAVENPISMSTAYNNIGCAYIRLKNFDRALIYFTKSSKIAHFLNDSIRIANAYGNQATVYSNKGNIEKALDLFYQEKEIRELIHNPSGLAITYNNIGSKYLEIDELDSANRYLLLAYNLKSELNLKNSLSYTQMELGGLYLERNQFLKAEEILLKARATAIDYENIYVERDAVSRLIDAYEGLGNFEKQNYFLQEKVRLLAAIGDIEKSHITSEYDFRYTSEKQKSKIELLKTSDELKALQLSTAQKRFIFSMSILFLIFVISITLYILLSRQKKANKQLVKKNVQLVRSEELLRSHNLNRQPHSIKPQKYAQSTISETEKNKIKEKIQYLMEEKRAFSDPSLTLNSFSEKLNVNRTYVSQVINMEFDVNFSSFVNQYRIKEVQRFLSSGKAELVTIESLAKDVGFNSKSAFNKAFKRYTGVTPSFYLKELSNSKKQSSN